MAQVILSPAALNDLQAIFDYIAKDSELYAAKVVDKILHRITVLETHIRVGKIVSEFQTEAIREIPEGNYRIIYRIENETEISVARIYHRARLLKEL